LISDNEIRETKALITRHTANSVHDCDLMFLPDFLKLDEMLNEELQQKNEYNDKMLEYISSLFSQGNSNN
jgi:hypothetical protein